MKILPTTIQYSYKTAKQNINKKNTPSAVINSNYSSNPMSELIGRSQVVSFSASNKNSGALFEHECIEMFKEKDRIVYNKQDGSLTHQIFRRDGTLKRQEEYYPKDDTEIITRVDTDGSKTVTKKTGMAISSEKFNSDEQQIYYSIRDDIGNERQIQTDYERGRRVFYSKSPDKKPVIKVLDLTTGTYVTSGPLVADRVYNKESDTYYTENIVTGRILKEEKYFPNDKLKYSFEYSENTGNTIKKVYFNEQTGGYEENKYDEFGVKQSLIKTSKNGRNVRVYIYAQDGKTIVDDKEYIYKKNKSLESEITYHPGTDIIDREKVYTDNNCYTVFRYKKSPNVPEYAEYFENGALKEQISYYKDGKNIYFVREYNNDDSYNETFFGIHGQKLEVKKFSSDGFLYNVLNFNSKTGVIIKCIEIDRKTGETETTHYDENTGSRTRLTISDSRGIVKEVLDYYQDGKTPRRKISYNFDRSYCETLFDTTGQVKSRINYNADGSRKVYSSNSTNSHKYYRNTREPYVWEKDEQDTESEESFIKRMNNTISANKKDKLSLNDWQMLASILGVNDVDKIKKIDNDLFKKLVLKFHPDRFQNREDEERCTILMQIINSLHNKKQI